MRLPGIISTLVVLVFSSVIWWYGTDGFRAFTSETARRIDVLEQPFQTPEVAFKDHNGQSVRFNDYHGKIVLTDFIYTSCADVCHNLGYAFKQLQERLKEKGLLHKVMIISISFDSRDKQAQLKAYLQRYTKDADSWHALSLEHIPELKNLLSSFGVVAIENESGGFEHNAAIHIIDQTGKLSAIYDYQSVDHVLAFVEDKIIDNPTHRLAYEM